jgi:integrase
MENAEKLYGFYLLKIPSTNYKSGFYYAVKYKDFESKKWLSTKTSTNTDNETLAKAYAIENRERIIKEYKEHAEKLHKKNDGKEFYRMLEEYYTADSKYLKDDYANNKRIVTKKNRTEYNGVIKTYFIPYFKENKINSIQEITRSVYSGLKLYLQNVKNKKGENLSTKSINNYLIILNRIFQYHERNEIISKLPYSKGTGILKISKEEKANSKKPQILPTDKLKGIFGFKMGKIHKKRENTLLNYTLSLIGLTTGMRDSEIGRIKVSDIIYVKEEDYFYLKAYNHKTEYYNVKETDEYRKIPLHPFVVEALKKYIKEKNIGKNDYIFGTPKLNDDTKQIDGYLDQSKTHKSIMYLYTYLQLKEAIMKIGIETETERFNELVDDEKIKKEMNEKRIVFYSLRHTFNTLCVLHRFNDTDTTRDDNIIDYFMGHKMASKMMENYTHINKADSRTFYDTYGKFLIEMLDKFIFVSEKEKEARRNYVKKFQEENNTENNEWIKQLLDTLRKKGKNTENDDDVFTSV